MATISHDNDNKKLQNFDAEYTEACFYKKAYEECKVSKPSDSLNGVYMIFEHLILMKKFHMLQNFDVSLRSILF